MTTARNDSTGDKLVSKVLVQDSKNNFDNNYDAMDWSKPLVEPITDSLAIDGSTDPTPASDEPPVEEVCI